MTAAIISAGWPIPASSAALAAFIARGLRQSGVLTRSVLVSDLPAQDLVNGRVESKPIAQTFDTIQRAEAVVIIAAAYPAAEACLIKVLLCLLRENALRDKLVLPIAVGHCQLHSEAADAALRPTLVDLGASRLLPTLHAADAQLTPASSGEMLLEDDLALRLQHAVRNLIHEIDTAKTSWIERESHPRLRRRFIHALPLAEA